MDKGCPGVPPFQFVADVKASMFQIVSVVNALRMVFVGRTGFAIKKPL